MTDKELMEEYIQGYKEDICGQCSECNTECDDDLNTQLSGYKDGFLAGLNAGRLTKWHDLRKNPDDLPEDKQLVIVKREGIEEEQDTFYTQGWESVIEGYCDDNPIAWCEIPKYVEE